MEVRSKVREKKEDKNGLKERRRELRKIPHHSGRRQDFARQPRENLGEREEHRGGKADVSLGKRSDPALSERFQGAAASVFHDQNIQPAADSYTSF
ncbi:hypothetical protein BDY24DRAFT_380742 [Mrakia frigida]|uniref:uncharacterized protein n=1 Tax=Mrakia frigida TaxID=29902 RepID=UPI003FCBF783